MIDVEKYYLSNLKGKSEKEILSTIRSLKKQINHLKDVIEHPDYKPNKYSQILEKDDIISCRLYIDRAKETLREIGCEYHPTKSEIKAQLFQDNIENISKITLFIGGYFLDFSYYYATINQKEIIYDEEHSIIENPDNISDKPKIHLSKQEFLDGIRQLYMGEWLHSYNTERFGFFVCDGTQWSIEIEYSNGMRKRSFGGSNSYPYNFNEFGELFGVYDIVGYDECEDEYDEE